MEGHRVGFEGFRWGLARAPAKDSLFLPSPGTVGYFTLTKGKETYCWPGPAYSAKSSYSCLGDEGNMIAFLLLLNLAQASPLDRILEYGYTLDSNNRPVTQIFNRPAPRFSDLEKNKSQYNDYESFLSYLKRSYPGMFEHPVLLHQSQSLQKASPEHPRVLLFDGGVVMAFSDHPDQKGRRIEMLETEPGTYEMRFREIIFEPSGGVTFQAEPQSCFACHGTPARPIWSPYDFWANSFGSNAGRFTTTEERKAYAGLSSKASADSGIIGKLSGWAQGPTNMPDMFTFYLQMLNLGGWVQRNIPADVKQAPYIYSLAYVLNNCNAKDEMYESEEVMVKDVSALLQGLLPQSLLNSFTIPYADVVRDTDESYLAFRSVLENQYEESFPKGSIENRPDGDRLRKSGVNYISQIRWVLENSGVDWRGVNAGFNKVEYFITTPSFFPADFLNVLAELRPQYFQDLRYTPMDMYTGANHWVSFNCDQLKKKSVQALSAAPSAPAQVLKPFYEVSTSNSPVAACMKCHSATADRRSSEEEAPEIPFDRPERLALWLKKQKGSGLEKVLNRIERQDSKRMPPKQSLSDHEQQALKAYLETL